MSRTYRLAPWLVLALLGTGLLPRGGEAQARVTLDWLYPTETIFFSDFDPFGAGQQPDLFAATIQNTTGQPQRIVLELAVTMIQPRSIFLMRASTRSFDLSSGVRRITNRELATTGRDVSAAEFEFGPESAELTDQVQRTGRFPSGRYRFQIEIRTPQGIVLDRASVERELVNPSRVELLSPGRPFGEPPPVVTSFFPRFLWSIDGAFGEADFQIRLSEVEEATSAEEAMANFANWEERVRGATTAIYPASVAALPLEPGKTYAWQVVRELRTSGGVEEIESPIYWFRMTGGAPVQSEISQQLLALLQSLGLGSEVEGFQLTGAASVEGRPMSREAFAELLRRIGAGEIQVGQVTVR